MLQYYPKERLDMIPSSEREFCGLSAEGWYFWNEAETKAFGPFADIETARRALNDYCTTILLKQMKGIT